MSVSKELWITTGFPKPETNVLENFLWMCPFHCKWYLRKKKNWMLRLLEIHFLCFKYLFQYIYFYKMKKKNVLVMLITKHTREFKRNRCCFVLAIFKVYVRFIKNLFLIHWLTARLFEKFVDFLTNKPVQFTKLHVKRKLRPWVFKIHFILIQIPDCFY